MGHTDFESEVQAGTGPRDVIYALGPSLMCCPKPHFFFTGRWFQLSSPTECPPVPLSPCVREKGASYLTSYLIGQKLLEVSPLYDGNWTCLASFGGLLLFVSE